MTKAPTKPARSKATPPQAAIKRINVALQGGGAHGAFTWGVLDRLLEDERLEIEAISGTSAGAMNAVVTAEGLVEGGRVKARDQLGDFWKAVADAMAGSVAVNNAWAGFIPSWISDLNPALAAFQSIAQATSPYQFNPLDINPLREIVANEVDFDRVHACTTMKLFVAATNVETGDVKVFTGRGITLDSVMASACLPVLYKAVEIDGVPYWDGGYVANPVLTPLITESTSQDLLIVQINPRHRAGTPYSSREILDRLNEITFNASLVREIDAIRQINWHLRRGNLSGTGYRDIFMHRIGGGKTAEAWSVSSKLSASWDFLCHLRDQGRAEAERWLANHFDDIGVKDTMDDDTN
jgi:NTE family protein